MAKPALTCIICKTLTKTYDGLICRVCYDMIRRLKVHLDSPMIKCKCGHCNNMIHSMSKNGLPQEFKQGHNSYLIKREGKKGADNYAWKGGRVKRHGYWHVKLHDHPYSNSQWYYPEHRYVLEQYYSKKYGIPIYILPILEVHHKNGIKTDNRVENLEILSKFKHRQHHFKKDMSNRKCVVCGSGETYHNKKTGYALWRFNKNGDPICHKCKRSYFNNKKSKEDLK